MRILINSLIIVFLFSLSNSVASSTRLMFYEATVSDEKLLARLQKSRSQSKGDSARTIKIRNVNALHTADTIVIATTMNSSYKVAFTNKKRRVGPEGVEYDSWRGTLVNGKGHASLRIRDDRIFLSIFTPEKNIRISPFGKDLHLMSFASPAGARDITPKPNLDYLPDSIKNIILSQKKRALPRYNPEER